MIRTEQGYAQIFKIYGKSETEVKEKLQDLLKCGGAVVIYTRRRGKDVHVLAETQAEDEESAVEQRRSRWVSYTFPAA